MKTRVLVPELMDDPQLDRLAHRQALAGLDRINDWTGTAALIWRAIRDLARRQSVGSLRHQRQWRDQVARSLDGRVWQIETDAIVPVEQASERAEYAARTIRPKLQAASQRFLTPLTTTPIDKHSLNLGIRGVDLGDLEQLTAELSIDRSVLPVADVQGGTRRAKQRLKQFLSENLPAYAERTLVVDPHVSGLSAWLHFGQISPLDMALRVGSSRSHAADQKAAFMEQLLVRRELSINFVYFHEHYDSLKCLPDWVRETLEQHDDDQRDPLYTAGELEGAETHDPAWNAAMQQMKVTGYLHNHMRMYWGKKILQWTSSHAHAYRTALRLNNRYFLDGRDANSYASIAWLFGMHDRAHQERNVFGKVRYMSSAGLERKIDVEQYVDHVRGLQRKE